MKNETFKGKFNREQIYKNEKQIEETGEIYHNTMSYRIKHI